MIESKRLRVLAEEVGAKRIGHQYGYETPIPQALTDAADEIELLRAVIKGAPHASGCSWHNTAAGLSCTCWKADVL